MGKKFPSKEVQAEGRRKKRVARRRRVIAEGSIGDLLDEIGDAFRGLWKSYYLDKSDKPNLTRWTVTFIYKGHYIETPDQATPEKALGWALKKLN